MTYYELAPYAMRDELSKGRRYPETFTDGRGAFERDRDRVIHSAAFRRLEYKTQVFVIHEGDYYRTRLTHTLEVAQIARSLAKRLRLNVDLAETIALAHDLGHTPFGHAGEEVLNELTKDFGGFEHNRQGLRIVDFLEERHASFPGLNLTWESREGIIKHHTAYDRPDPNIDDEFLPDKVPTLEAQIINVADEIAYHNHDLDDGIESGLLSFDALDDVEIWKTTKKDIIARHPGIQPKILKSRVVSSLIGRFINDAVETSLKNIGRYQIETPSDIRRVNRIMITFSPELTRLRDELKNYLLNKLYHHQRLESMKDKAKRIIRTLFEAYLKKPELMPDRFHRNATKDGHDKNRYRTVCDYIAGMTDRYAQQEYEKLCKSHGPPQP